MDEYSDADAPPPDEEQGFADVPFDRLAEQSVLGSMLLDGRVVDDVFSEVRPGDFYLPQHELIAAAIAALRDADEPVDVVSVTAKLTREGKLRQAGGITYPHELTSVPSTTANAGYWAGIVREHAVRRRLIEAGQRLIQRGRASEGDVGELVEAARDDLEAAVSGRRKPLQMLGSRLAELADYLDQEPTTTPTPWRALDKHITGFAPGRLYYVGARPGSGKTIALLNIATTLARQGAVAFSSLEMTEQELQMRLVASYGPVHMSSMSKHSLSESEWERFLGAKQAVQGAPIFVDDRGGQSMTDVRQHARDVARMGNLKAVVIDYLQLVKTEGADRRVAVDEVSRSAKRLAKELNVPVIAAVQLRRGKGLPGLDSLREAGGLEQDADVVILLHRDMQRPADVKVLVVKNRHGEQGTFTARFQGEYARIEERPWTPHLVTEEGA